MKWRADDSLIEQRVNEFVGKPFVLTPDKQHPPYDDVLFHRPDTYENLLKSQEKFRIGTIQKVESQPNDVKNAALGKTWYAYIEINDPKWVQAFKNGEIPEYISPSVYDPYNLPNYTSLIDFRANHIASTDKPAYGNKAIVRGSCSGSGPKCTAELKEASNSSQNQINEIKSDSLSQVLEQETTPKKPFGAQVETTDDDTTTTIEAVPEEVKSKVKKAKKVLDEVDNDNTQEGTQSQQQPSITAPLDPTKDVAPNPNVAPQSGDKYAELEARLAKFEAWQQEQTQQQIKNAAEQQRQLIESSVGSLGVEDQAKKQEVVDFLVGLGVDDENLKRLFGLIKALKGENPIAQQPQGIPTGMPVKQASVTHLFFKDPTPQATPKSTFTSKSQYLVRGFFD